MYRPNEIVEYEGQHGRVIYHDLLTHTIHVLFRVNNNTWKVEKCDPFQCKPAQVFLWTIESAVCSRYLRRQRTPELQSLKQYTDHVMKI